MLPENAELLVSLRLSELSGYSVELHLLPQGQIECHHQGRDLGLDEVVQGLALLGRVGAEVPDEPFGV